MDLFTKLPTFIQLKLYEGDGESLRNFQELKLRCYILPSWDNFVVDVQLSDNYAAVNIK